MAGQIKKTIDKIITAKAQNDAALTYIVQAKLALKGINVNAYDHHSDDDPVVLNKLRQIAKDIGVRLD